MATAPIPGAGARQEAAEAAKQVITLVVAGERYPLAFNNLPIAEKFLVRTSTGHPFEAFWSDGRAIGEDSIVVAWWLARRMNGEKALTWDAALQQWPGDFDIEIADDDDTSEVESPEALGPA